MWRKIKTSFRFSFYKLFRLLKMRPKIKLELSDSTELEIFKNRRKAELFIVASVRLATFLIFLGIFSIILFYALEFLNHLKHKNPHQDLTEFLSREFKCPKADEIMPCACEETDAAVNCEGSDVNATTIQLLLTRLRETNSISSEETLRFHTLRIQRTLLTNLDLMPFHMLRIRLEVLTIAGNPELTSISSSTKTVVRRSIQVKELNLNGNALSNDGLRNTLNYFSPIMTHLHLAHNQISGTDKNQPFFESEFLPGLSSLSQLTDIDLTKNHIQHMAMSQFKSNSKLQRLHLASNQIKTFLMNFDLFPRQNPNQKDDDKNADGYDPEEEEFFTDSVQVFLDGNDLGNQGFTFIKRTGRWGKLSRKNRRPISLNLQYNNLEYLLEAKFRPFLEAHSGNTIWISPINCSDSRMNWLKDFSDYSQQINYGHCKEDLSNSLFHF